MEQQYSTFSCRNCGSDMDYAIGEHSLKCISCGEASPIEESRMDFSAHDYWATKRHLEAGDVNVVKYELHCNNCGADFVLAAQVHADECPYCDTNVVVPLDLQRQIMVDGLMPFEVTQAQADASFKQWLKGLWFAPNALKRKALQVQPIVGSYMPLWSFDAKTDSRYSGSRGDNYVVTVRRNGQTHTEIRTRWRAVSGSVFVAFDDVLVLACSSLPLKFQNFLSNWDLSCSKSYDERYLSGFRSELYTIALPDGLEHAKKVMDSVIRGHIRRDIGGDQQIIHSVDTNYQQIGYQLILAPMWISAFSYKHKTYRYVINGQNGKAYGERPWSVWKITFAVLFTALAIAVGFYFSR